MAGKLVHVQALRGVACLLVVLAHLSELDALFGGRTPGLRQVHWFGFAGVDLFFVLSGFIITTTNQRNLGRPAAVPGYLLRRLWRIYPAYWAALLLVVLVRVSFLGTAAFDGCTANLWAGWLTLAPTVGENRFVAQAWTLGYEVMFYLVFGVLMLVPSRLAGAMLCGWAAAVAVLGRSAPKTAADLVVSPFMLEFLGGCLVAWFVGRGVGRFWRLAVAIGLAYAAVGVSVTGWAGKAQYLTVIGSHWARVAVFGPPAVLLVYGLVAAEGRVRWRVPGWLLRIGDASYSLYLTHAVVVGLGLWAGSGVPHNRLPHLLWLAGTFAAALAVGLAFHAWVECPLLNLAQRTRPAASSDPGCTSDPPRLAA